ncbi:MAG: 16S rRNA (guanine(966)-N(2))-methyltransferase RsmD [Ruminiclostridium sp.]|jgi:16S rRNA (guanine966-N2)-methyltransferase|nr:16S rRNA (guanine(966)-N(2))-methyltransferase RsmD [Ruminiclostridium sp.]
MRVITGLARGMRLREPAGLDTRPTTDRVKEGIFSSIQFDIEGRRVLDLFGGTGQMGIEALSRGATHCTFVDLSKQAAGIIRENLDHTGFAGQAAVIQGDYLSFLDRCREPFDLIFLDPPYGSGFLEKAMERIQTIDIVSGNGIIVCENGSGSGWPEPRGPYRLQREYRYGRIRTALYRRAAD